MVFAFYCWTVYAGIGDAEAAKEAARNFQKVK